MGQQQQQQPTRSYAHCCENMRCRYAQVSEPPVGLAKAAEQSCCPLANSCPAAAHLEVLGLLQVVSSLELGCLRCLVGIKEVLESLAQLSHLVKACCNTTHLQQRYICSLSYFPATVCELQPATPTVPGSGSKRHK